MKKFTMLVIFIIYSLVAYNQVIKGTILDKDTKSAIYSAAVYINGTFAGTLSDQNGNFQLDISKYVSMPVTISAIGYYSVSLTNFSTAKPLLIYLSPKLFELNEVVVKAKSHASERKVNLAIFKNEFLGTTSNSMYCKILNEDDIKFIYDSENDTVKAYALKPILIDNKALGYKITYYLDKFEYYKQNSSFFFKGNIFFKEDSTTKEATRQVFERKRKHAYLGSRMHFFRALWSDDLNSTGFAIRNSTNETITYNQIVSQKDTHTKYLRYAGNLGISYYTKKPTSFIVFLKKDIYFDASGYFDSGISWEGEMARQRIADLLPFEYSVKEYDKMIYRIGRAGSKCKC